MSDTLVEVKGMSELVKTIDHFADALEKQLQSGVKKAAENTAEDIQVVFKGGSSPGFQDRSGALRESIRGGLVDNPIPDTIQGFIGAGDDRVGSSNKPTREYVKHIEFGEFSKAGSTSFLRAGVQRFQRSIGNIIKDEVQLEDLV